MFTHRRYLLVIYFATFAANAACTQPPRKTLDQGASEKNGILFSVSAIGKVKGYLLGTAHLVLADEKPLSPRVEKLIARSKKIYLETNIINTDEHRHATANFAEVMNSITIKDLIARSSKSAEVNRLIDEIGLSKETREVIEKKPMFEFAQRLMPKTGNETEKKLSQKC